MSGPLRSLIDKIQPKETPQGIRQILVRDLTALFNTWTHGEQLPREAVEIKRSILTYGLPDLTALSLADQRNRLGKFIRNAIETFEPRLKLIRVEQMEDNASGSREAVQFRIEALLVVEEPPERITFDTELQTGTVWHVASR